MVDQATINRRNRFRGKAWEKRFAAFMGWTWVGSVRFSLQRGDVVDGFMIGGRWVAECKTQQPGALRNLSVRDSWLRQMWANARRTDRWPVLALAIQGLLKTYVVVPAEVVEAFSQEVLLSDPSFVVSVQNEKTKARGKGWGFVVQRSWLDRLPAGSAMRLDVYGGGDDGTERTWFWVVPSGTFRDLVRNHGLDVAKSSEEARVEDS